VHSAARILPSYNYCGNPAHKTSECNIPSKDLFCDYCGKEGHQEVVCFAKLPDKSSHNTSQAFLQQVLSRFKACAECLTDQGSEFRGKFQNLLNHALMDHRRTSRDHPEVDGLAKKMVQTCKKGFQKICFTKNKEDWDLVLLYIAMGYKMSKHASLSHFSPYFLLFGRHPMVQTCKKGFHPLPLLLKWTKLWTWTLHPLGLGSSQRGLFYSKGLCPWPWRTCPLHSIETPYGMHIHEVAVTNLR
jgi:hypothetical protein